VARFPARPLVLGHRGAPREAPENTLEAFRRARAHGADGIELDVRPSADGVGVVIHDPTLERTTDGAGRVDSLSWAMIEGVRSRGEPVPRMEQVAAWAKETGAWLNVEVKSPGAEAPSLAAIRGAGLLGRAFFSSFVPEVVAELGRLEPAATRCFLTERWDAEARAAVRALGVSGVCLHDPIATPAVLDELSGASLDVVVWTVDDPARLRALLGAGVRAVITNFPARGVAALREVVG
jgi:glycerophosphoryl diester phosphodiesterase